jgi:hypothetical protein
MRSNTATYNMKTFIVEEFGGTAQRNNFGNIYKFHVVGGL